MTVKKYTFYIQPDEMIIEDFISRYHFEKKDAKLIEAAGIFLADLIVIMAEVSYQPEGVTCAVTLGECYDHLENLVAESGHLLLSYCLECFGMEFLSTAYGKLNEAVYAETGKWMGSYCFLEDSDMEAFCRQNVELKQIHMTWQNGMLHPLKSVIFTAEYKMERKESGCHTCETCQNLACSFRKAQNVGENRNHEKGKQEAYPGLKGNGITTQKNTGQPYSYGISRILEKGSTKIRQM